jgi:hypothetical protein
LTNLLEIVEVMTPLLEASVSPIHLASGQLGDLTAKGAARGWKFLS